MEAYLVMTPCWLRPGSSSRKLTEEDQEDEGHRQQAADDGGKVLWRAGGLQEAGAGTLSHSLSPEHAAASQGGDKAPAQRRSHQPATRRCVFTRFPQISWKRCCCWLEGLEKTCAAFRFLMRPKPSRTPSEDPDLGVIVSRHETRLKT
ncbi:hypothetical protein EYF80_055594 [Liparis tanakae]|uniref:Uncharacterized protein n=1 Tax=Liparis tanakae TaxID=230148 RepID=A0A4Z2F033_9TELE|nr:hypothetical protein EYF80_055594 [Liparis tanakae]